MNRRRSSSAGRLRPAARNAFDVPRRRGKLQRIIARHDADGLLVVHPANIYYLTGFTGEDSWLVVTRDGALLISDSRFTHQIAEETDGIEVAIAPLGVTRPAFRAQTLEQMRLARLAVESHRLSHAEHAELERSLPRTTLVPGDGWVESLRVVKDRAEIAEIERSVAVAERAYRAVQAGWTGAESESNLAAELEYRIRLLGGSGCSFPPIVAGGVRAALPHARPTEAELGRAPFILIDWGAIVGGYASDLTRVWAVDRIPPKLARVYQVVLQAQLAAIDRLAPGVTLGDVDRAARQVIESAGFGARFGHALGHGIGLEVHEAPRVGPRQKRPLKAGMVVTVEPGIYLPAWGGVRIEDDVLVTRNGHRVLSTLPKEQPDIVERLK